MTDAVSPVFLDPFSFSYIVGIDIGSEVCCMTVLTPHKQVVIKPTTLANAASGFVQLQGRLERLGVAADRIVVGEDATSRYGENLFHASRSAAAMLSASCIPDRRMSLLSNGGCEPRLTVWMPRPSLESS